MELSAICFCMTECGSIDLFEADRSSSGTNSNVKVSLNTNEQLPVLQEEIEARHCLEFMDGLNFTECRNIADLFDELDYPWEDGLNSLEDLAAQTRMHYNAARLISSASASFRHSALCCFDDKWFPVEHDVFFFSSLCSLSSRSTLSSHQKSASAMKRDEHQYQLFRKGHVSVFSLSDDNLARVWAEGEAEDAAKMKRLPAGHMSKH